MLHYKIFVKENETTKIEKETEIIGKYFPKNKLTGVQAKDLYENIVQLHEPPPPKRLQKRKITPKKRNTIKFDLYKTTDIFHAAQNNDVEKLSNILATVKFDINAVDSYGWTPLMCAACSGAQHAVKLLLNKGADVKVCDKSKNTATSLAKKNNHSVVVEMIRQFKKVKIKQMKSVKAAEGGGFFCELCQQQIKSDKSKHDCSTVHLLNRKGVKNKTFYGIPDSNKGFQMMLRNGWDREHGLGPDGQGKKYPIKTKQKNSRSGIGAVEPPRNKPKSPRRDLNKKEISETQRQEQIMERNFRLEFS